jgi:hypothetical protein
MTKYFLGLYILALIVGLVIFGALANAQTESVGPSINILTNSVATKGGYDTQGTTSSTLYITVGNIVKAILGMTGTIFLILTVYAGILWMTAAGKDEQVEKATKIFQTSIIGLIVIVGAYSITHYVLKAVFSVSGIK